MASTTAHQTYPHLSAASDALGENPESIPVGTIIVAGGAKFRLTTVDGDHEICWAPLKGGRCYPIWYCVGEGRTAIERTARMREQMAAAR